VVVKVMFLVVMSSLDEGTFFSGLRSQSLFAHLFGFNVRLDLGDGFLESWLLFIVLFQNCWVFLL
jgi:hypothetical protein